MPSASASERQPAAALQRREPPRQRDGADHRRVRPVQRGAGERLPQHPRVERGVVGHQHAAAHQRRQLGQRRLGRRRQVDHVLGDPGEALDAAPERLADAHQRLPAVVQLAPADQHGADLGELAALAPQPVRLGVERQELGGGEGLGQEVRGEHADPGSYASRRTHRTGRCRAFGAHPGRVG